MAAAAIVMARKAKENAEGMEERTDDELLEEVLQEKAEGKFDLPEYKDPEKHEGAARAFLEYTKPLDEFVKDEPFSNFIIFVILLAGIMIGAGTYPAIEAHPVYFYIDMVILAIFVLEVVLKMLSEGLRPWMYFANEEYLWNWFDFWIVVLCMPGWDAILGGDSGPVALLRLMRLMRVAKIIKKIPQLQMIIMGLVGGLRSIVYILVLLLLVFYLFAIVGIYAFRDNDPFHFGDIFVAHLTLFRCSTLEDWTDVMYINMYGCDPEGPKDWGPGYMYDSGIYTTDPAKANPNGLPVLCDKPNPQMFASFLYFFIFTCVSALVMLSLFIGAVTMSMTESMEEMKNLAKEEERKEQLLKAREKAERERLAAESREKGELTRRDTSPSLDKEEQEALDQLKLVLLSAWDGLDLMSLLSQNNEGKADDIDNQYLRMYYVLTNQCAQLTESSQFENFITGVILVAGLMVGIGTARPIEIVDYDECLKAGTFDCTLPLVLFLIDTVVLAIFTFEVVVKMIAVSWESGTIVLPVRYFWQRSQPMNWNIFDFVIVVGSFLPMGDAQSIVTMLRLLRLLRVLKLVKSLPELQVIVVALMDGVKSIMYIGLILVLFFYVFAIVAILIFRKNDPWHFQSLHLAMVTLFRASTMEDWTDIMYINIYGCLNYGYDIDAPVPPPNATRVTYWPETVIVNGSNTTIMRNRTQPYYPTPMGCNYVDSYAHGAVSAIFFVIFVLIGALVLMTLFIGVVTTSMEEASEKQKEEQEVWARVMEIAEAEGLDKSAVEMYEMCFNMIDIDRGGTIDEEELRIALKSIGKVPSEEEMSEMMLAVDEDGSGEIDLAEFVEFMMNLKKRDENKASAAQGSAEDENPDRKVSKAGGDWDNFMEELKEDHRKEQEFRQRKRTYIAEGMESAEAAARAREELSFRSKKVSSKKMPRQTVSKVVEGDERDEEERRRREDREDEEDEAEAEAFKAKVEAEKAKQQGGDDAEGLAMEEKVHADDAPKVSSRLGEVASKYEAADEADEAAPIVENQIAPAPAE